MNLLCAGGLPGADELPLSEYLRRMEALTTYARRSTERDIADFRRDPAAWGCSTPFSESRFRVGLLVTYLKRDCGLRYNPDRVGDGNGYSPYLADQDARDIFINGLLSDRRSGTCASIPVIVAAVGRRLGYPLYLVTDGRHVWARWDDGRDRFNIEASNLAGFTEQDDDYYRGGGGHARPMSEADIRSGYYLRNLLPEDELALFLSFRAAVLADNLQFEEALPAWAKCCALAPAEPHYPRHAYETLLDAMYKRKFGKVMPRGGPQRRAKEEIHFDARELFPAKQAAMAASIKGHWHEVRNETGNALLAYKAACELEPGNADFQADRERFAKWLEGLRIESERKARAMLKLHAPDPYAVKVVPSASSEQGVRQSAMVATWESHGLRSEREGKLADAQAAFVQGMAFASEDQPECYAYLSRVIRKDLLAAPQGVRPEMDADDPRLKLPPQLQSRLWAMRAKALESMGRINEAVLAFGEASILVPDNPEYPLEVHRLAQSAAPRQRQPQARPPIPFGPATTIWGVPGLFEFELGKE